MVDFALLPNGPKEQPLRDATQVFVHRTICWLLIFTATIGALMSIYHWTSPNPDPVSLVIPPIWTLIFAGLALRQWRQPQHSLSTIWTAWIMVVIALAAPAWIFVARALRTGESLVEILPPINAMFLPAVLGMVVFAQPRRAIQAAVFAWLVIAGPVLAYLATHTDQLHTPRGLDMAISLGPFVLLILLLIPYLKGLEHRFQRLEEQRERLQRLAERDALTGLYNRRAGEHWLGNVLVEPTSCSAILFDLDHFKSINDTHGHPAGDAVLQEVARRCARLLRREDVFARWGGEEFLVLLPHSSPAEAMNTANRLRLEINAEPMPIVGQISASFGLTEVRRDDSLSSLLQRADDALYRAKAEGRNRVVMG